MLRHHLWPIVQEAMTPHIVSVNDDRIVGEAVEKMVEHRCHSLIVRTREGRPWGMIHDVDVLRGDWRWDIARRPDQMRYRSVREFARVGFPKIEQRAPMRLAVQRMTDEGYLRLMVTENSMPRGYLTVSDACLRLGEWYPDMPQRVGEAMTWGISVCRADTPIKQAARSLAESSTGVLAVLGKRRRMLGMVEGIDLVFSYWHNRYQTVSEVMRQPRTIDPHSTLRKAADVMVFKRTDRLLVVDPDDPESLPLGILNARDIAAAVANAAPAWVLKQDYYYFPEPRLPSAISPGL